MTIIEYYKPTTTDAVMQYLCIDEETLFWIKIDVASMYLTDKYGDDVRNVIIKSERFWNWFLRMWEIQDKRFLNSGKASKKGFNIKDYSWYQYYNNLPFHMDPKDFNKHFNHKNTNHETKENIDHR